jgi:hypothetical protein
MAECWGNFFTRPEFRKEAMLTGSAEQQEIAVALKSLTRPTDRVFVWGEEPTLIWLMERPICPPYFHMIQYAPPWPAPERFDREMASIRAEPPAAIVVCASRTWWRPEPFADLLLQYPDLIAFLEARYARERRVGYYNVWLRKS